MSQRIREPGNGWLRPARRSCYLPEGMDVVAGKGDRESRRPSKRRRWALRLGVASLSALSALLMCELAARCMLRTTPPSAMPDQTELAEYDPLLAWRMIPSRTVVIRTSEYTVELNYNAKGIRGPEYTYEKRPSEYRVLVVGDSFCAAVGVPFESLFSEVLKAQLNRGETRYCEVINSGVPGYSTDQELLYFETEGRRYRPDLTVLPE